MVANIERIYHQVFKSSSADASAPPQEHLNSEDPSEDD